MSNVQSRSCGAGLHLPIAGQLDERRTSRVPGDSLGNGWEQGSSTRRWHVSSKRLALRPDYAEAHRPWTRSLRDSRKPKDVTATRHDADLAALEALAADTHRLPPAKMLYVHFALGKALEDVGDYPRAFEHLLQGNALKRREVKYDEAGYQRAFRAIAELFDASAAGSLRRGGRSFTCAHLHRRHAPFRQHSDRADSGQPSTGPRRRGTEESGSCRESVSDSDGQPVPFPQCISALDADGLRRLGQAYLASLPTLAVGKIRITDKALANFLHVGLIRLILPNARIIHTLRDPVDTCFSCFSRLFPPAIPFSYDLAELGCYYRWYHELMEHWRSVLPAGAMLDVSYEDVVDNLEQQARRLIDYCGLPWDDRCLNFHETNRPIATASNVQVRRPLYRSSLARWRRYEAYLRPLLTELDICRQ